MRSHSTLEDADNSCLVRPTLESHSKKKVTMQLISILFN